MKAGVMDRIYEWAKQSGLDKPIKPSQEAIDWVMRETHPRPSSMAPNISAAQYYRLAQSRELIIRALRAGFITEKELSDE